MRKKEDLLIEDRHVNTAFSIPLSMFQEMEDSRWKMKLTRSEFVRLAIKLFLENNEPEG